MNRNEYWQAMALHSPEGAWKAIAERRPLALSFNPDLVSSIAIVKLKKLTKTGHDADYIITSAAGSIYMYTSALEDPPRRVDIRGPLMGNSSPSAGFVTALGSSAQRGLEYDLLVGTSTGEIKAMSVVAQLASPPTAIRPIKALTFNSGGAVNPTRCIAVAFVPGTSGASFLSVHADGTVLQHLLPAVAQQPGISSETAAAAPQLPPATQLVGPGSPAAAAAVSPDGSLLAVAGRHGTLRVYDTTTGALQCGFHSYYGGFLCCAWSPDGRCVAAGGEDDLVAVYSLEERAVIAHCQGHSSFLSSVAFDPHAPVEPDLIRYRIASVAQDCQVALWEVEVLGEGKGGASWAAAKGVRGGGGGLGLGRVAPSLPRADMCFVAPLVHKKVHYEPLSDVKFVKDGLLVAGFDGIVKKWARPPEQGSLAGSHMA